VCVRCGYNLTGLSAESNCPECGLSIDATLRTKAPLAHADPAFVARLAVAVPALLVALGLLALFELRRMMIAFAPYDNTIHDSYFAVWGYSSYPEVLWTFAIGILFTSPDPDRAVARAEAYTARVVLRITSYLYLATQIIVVRYFLPDVMFNAVPYIHNGLYAVILLSYLLYWRHLSRRAGDPFLLTHVPVAVGAQLGVFVLSFLFQAGHIRSFSSDPVDEKLLSVLAVATLIYHLVVLNHFRNVMNRASHESLEHWRGADGSPPRSVLIDPRRPPDDSTPP
jgi:hypothetical protein